MGVTTDTWPFIGQATSYTMKFDYDANGNQIYVGWSLPGALSSDPNWRIMKQIFNVTNQITDVQWCQGSIGFNFIWDNRVSLTFS